MLLASEVHNEKLNSLFDQLMEQFPTLKGAKEFFEACDVEFRVPLLTKFIENADDNSQLTAKKLIDIATIDAKLTEFIFTDETCLTVLSNDPNTHTHIGTLCKHQTNAVYRLIWNRNTHKLRKEIFEKLQTHRLILSELLSFYDNLSSNPQQPFIPPKYALHMTFGFTDENALIEDEDGQRNFNIICRSQIRARHLVYNVLSNKFVGHFPHISFDSIIAIANQYAALIPEVVQLFHSNRQSDPSQFNAIIKDFIPALIELQDTNPLAKLVYAQILFTGLEPEITQDCHAAIQMCYEVIQSKNDLNHEETYQTLFAMAQGLWKGKFLDTHCEKDIHFSYVVYDYIKTKASMGSSIKTAASNVLSDARFRIELGQYLESDLQTDLAHKIYSETTLPELPKLSDYPGMGKYNDEKMITYAKGILMHSLIQRYLFMVRCNLLEGIKAPEALFGLIKILVNKKFYKEAFILLKELNEFLPEKMNQSFSEFCYQFARDYLIKEEAFGEACLVFSWVREKTVGAVYKNAQSFLKFSGEQVHQLAFDSHKLTKFEILKLKLAIIEDLYAIMMDADQNQRASNYYGYQEVQPVYQAFVDVTKELIKYRNSLVAELYGKNENEIPVISKGLLSEIQSFDKEKNLSKAVRDLGMLSHSRKVGKPAVKWQQNDEGCWSKMEKGR